VTFVWWYYTMAVVTLAGVGGCLLNMLGAIGDYRASVRSGSPLKRSIAWAYVRGGIVSTVTILAMFMFSNIIIAARLRGGPLGYAWATVAVVTLLVAALAPSIGALLAYRARQRMKKLVEPPTTPPGAPQAPPKPM